MAPVTVRQVRTFLTAPEGITLAVVRVDTSEPGLYGLGCATFTQRAAAVKATVDAYLGPLAEGRDVSRIEDFWAVAQVNGYWRNGPVLNAALSGIDMALWDIKGKMAGLPCYDLWGGKCREGAAVYRHADGSTVEAVLEKVAAWLDEGVRHIRCQIGGYGGVVGSEGGEPRFGNPRVRRPEGAVAGNYFDPESYTRSVLALMEAVRSRFGPEIEILHDVHERLEPASAVRFARDLEPYHLFFLEDALAPEDQEWFSLLRAKTVTPLAMGELFSHPLEWMKLIDERLIDFIRVHPSQIGGITPARKLAVLAAAHGVRTAWHGPGDVSPIGHAANVHLDVSQPNFGIQEWSGISERLEAIFPGSPKVRDGYVYPNDRPGLGIAFDEAEAGKFPPRAGNPTWTEARTPDGTSVRP